jgi:hypothetical protein
MKRIEKKLTFKNGSTLLELEPKNLLAYRKHRGVKVYKVPFQFNDGQYSLGSKIHLGGPVKNRGKYLSEKESVLILEQIRKNLSKSGFSVNPIFFKS